MCHLYFYCIFLLKLADTVTELPNATPEGPADPGMRLQDEMNTGDRKVVVSSGLTLYALSLSAAEE